MIHTPVLNHDCEMFKNYELKLIALKIDDELEKPAIEILHSVRQGIIKPIELQPANSSSIISTAGSSFGTASSADQFPSSCGVNHVYRYSSSLSLNVPKKHVVAASVPKYFTFRNKIETVIKHYYRPKGTTFLVTWQGFDLPPMEEPLMLVMELGKGPLKEYLSRCGRRALTTLLRRHPEIGGMTRNSIWTQTDWCSKFTGSPPCHHELHASSEAYDPSRKVLIHPIQLPWMWQIECYRRIEWTLRNLWNQNRGWDNERDQTCSRVLCRAGEFTRPTIISFWLALS